MKKILFSLMAVAVAIGLVGGAFAYFTDSADSATNSFTAGTLSINDSLVASTTAIAIPNMAPGDVTGPFVVIIKNNGSLPLAWGGNWVFTGPSNMKEAIYIDYAQMEFLDLGDNPNNWEPTDNFITDGVGSGSYPGWFNTLATANAFDVVGLNQWDGNNGMGSTPYEHIGALKPGYSYKLTVKFGFAALADNTYQGAGPVTAALTVDAFQMNRSALPTALLSNWDSVPNWFQAQLNKQLP